MPRAISLIRSYIPSWDVAIVLAGVISYGLIFSYFSILRHMAFASNYDLGNMDQTVWNTAYGTFFSMTSVEGTVSRLATHADFILIVLAPMYYLWNDVRMLLIIQSVLLGLGAVPVYFLAKKIIKKSLPSMVFPLIYLLNPAMQWVNMYDFHGVALAIPFLLAAFYFGYAKRWRWYWLFFVLAIITKEEISLVLAGMGGLFAVMQRSWSVGIATILIGISWFLLMIFIAIPSVSVSGEHWAFEHFFKGTKQALDTGDTEQLEERFRVTKETINYIDLLLKPFAYLPLLGLPWVGLVLPDLGINLLGESQFMQTILFHYQSGIIPGLVIASIFGFLYLIKLIDSIGKKFKSLTLLAHVFPYALAIFLLAVSVKVSVNYSPINDLKQYQVTEVEQEFARILKEIPQEAVISASGEIRSHISHRKEAYNLPTIPNHVEYIALIDEDRLIFPYKPHQYEKALVEKLYSDPTFTLIYQNEHYYLFKRNQAIKSSL